MSVQLLDRVRKINKLLNNAYEGSVDFTDLCQIMTDILGAAVLAIDDKGVVLGNTSPIINMDNYNLILQKENEIISSDLNERFLSTLSTKENFSLDTIGFDNSNGFEAIISPILSGGERLGTIFSYRIKEKYEIDDIIITEYVASLIGIALMKYNNDAKKTRENQKKLVKRALSTLTDSEKIAMGAVFDYLDGFEGVVVASSVADDVGITRSIVVNALKKLDSAGVITCRSRGKMGTYIKITNDILYEALDRKKD